MHVHTNCHSIATCLQRPEFMTVIVHALDVCMSSAHIYTLSQYLSVFLQYKINVLLCIDNVLVCMYWGISQFTGQLQGVNLTINMTLKVKLSSYSYCSSYRDTESIV